MPRRWAGTWVWVVLLVCRSRSFPLGHRQPLEDFFFMFDRLYFFRVVLDSQQYWREDTEISHIHPALTYAQPPSLSTSHTRGAQMMNLHRHTLILQILPFVLGSLLMYILWTNLRWRIPVTIAYGVRSLPLCSLQAVRNSRILCAAQSGRSLCAYLCGPSLSRCLAHSRCSINIQ